MRVANWLLSPKPQQQFLLVIKSFHEAAVGNGPVNAVDTAMRKALVAAYPSLADVELVDYKVRILDAAEGSGTGCDNAGDD